MNPRKLLVIYATVDGQAALVAQRIAAAAAESGVDATLRDVRQASSTELGLYESAILVASVRYGRHSRTIVRFVKANRARLTSMSTAFVSVSGSAVDPATRPEAEQYVKDFVRSTGWTPGESQLVGGAVKFSRYNPLVRFVTRRALAAKGQNLDTRRDYDYTDWEAVTRFAKAFVANGPV
jgi:menaquinone-dependent protoporphyrinogen oxidase